MSEVRCRGLLVADFTVGHLANHLAADETAPIVESKTVPGMSVIAALADERAAHWQEQHDFCVVWSRPEMISPAFAARASLSASPTADALADVDLFCSAIARAAARVPLLFVPTWMAPSGGVGAGLLDMSPTRGVAGLLLQMNARLVERLADIANVYVLDASKWALAVGPANPTFWYTAKVPFAPQVFKLAAAEIKTALAAARGFAKKLLVLDLDNTLWGGVVGEVGWERVRLGGHDALGEAFVDFQQNIKRLSRRGVILALVSKNDEARAIEGMRNHPEMVLRPDDFAALRINWTDKAANIAEIVDELNIGIDAVVFIDDHPAERDRVREALPRVLVPEWPPDVMRYSEALAGLRCFDTLGWTSEDSERNKMYVAERERQHVRDSVGSLDEWLASLGTKVIAEPLDERNFDRTLQLINKTNQMNLQTRRLDSLELATFRDSEQRSLWTFRVSDRFGDAGIVGVASLEHDGKRGYVRDFLLSCRVFGRKIEDAMLTVVLQHANSVGLEKVELQYLVTAKNGVTREFLERTDLESDTATATFRWSRGRPIAAPPFLELMTRARTDTQIHTPTSRTLHE